MAAQNGKKWPFKISLNRPGFMSRPSSADALPPVEMLFSNSTGESPFRITVTAFRVVSRN